MTRFVGNLALAFALFAARDAFAVGGILSSHSDPATVVEARFAIATSRVQTTRWASLRVAHFPGAMAWILPVRPGARVDESTDAWFEALEIATAPRIVEPVCNADAAAPRVRVEGRTLHEETARALHIADLADAADLHGFASAWGLDLPAEVENRVAVLVSRGFTFVGLVYGAAGARVLTRTVRITDDSSPVLPLFLTSNPTPDPIRVTAFMIGETRARVATGEESEIDPATLSFDERGPSSYDESRLSVLRAGRGALWLVEAADHAFFFDGVPGPARAETAAPIITTYLDRARSYGDSASEDLALALSGLDPTTAWLTRAAGIIPASMDLGGDPAVVLVANRTKSPFVVVGSKDIAACQVGAPISTGEAGAPVSRPGFADAGALGPPNGTDAGTARPTTPAPSEPWIGGNPPAAPIDPGPQMPQPKVVVRSEGTLSCGCSPGESEGDRSDGCDGSADGSGDTSDPNSDGCDGSSDDSSSDDGCDGGDSSDGSNDGCGGDASNDDARCAVSRRTHRGRRHTSAVGFGIAAVLLPLRRLTRPRRNGQRARR